MHELYAAVEAELIAQGQKKTTTPFSQIAVDTALTFLRTRPPEDVAKLLGWKQCWGCTKSRVHYHPRTVYGV